MGGRFTFLLQVEEAPESEILDALQQGMRSEVEYRVQLYRETQGFWSFFGDRLIEEFETHHVAYFDPFTRSYTVVSSGAFAGGERSFEDAETFLEAFLTVSSTPISLPSRESEYWIRGRSVVRPIRVAPPLGLIGAFLSSPRHGTAWAALEL